VTAQLLAWGGGSWNPRNFFLASEDCATRPPNRKETYTVPRQLHSFIALAAHGRQKEGGGGGYPSGFSAWTFESEVRVSRPDGGQVPPCLEIPLTGGG